MNFTELLCVGNETFLAAAQAVQNCTASQQQVQYELGDAFWISLYVMAPVMFVLFCAYVVQDQEKKRKKQKVNRVMDGTRIEDIL